MPRPLRPIADGLIYHVINRGNNRQTVFESEGDYAAFLKAIADLKERKPFELYGYCLMGNHIHILLLARGNTRSAASRRACWFRTRSATTVSIGRAGTSGRDASRAP